MISDIYFLEIRPFDRNYRRAEQGGGGGMGGDGGFDNTLSVQQKMIISATFRLVRDAEEYSDREMSENLTTVALMQGRLRDQVGALITRMGNRGQQLLGDEEFSKIIEFLQQAATEMAVAQRELEEERPAEAMTVEKQALASLQRAESAFRELTVSFQQGGGGGGGGSQQQLSEDLADLFELELDKLRNQYETVQRGEAEQTQAEIDELMQKLRELGRRQQRENERQNRLRGRQQQGGGGGGSQQQLIDETEELARRLERLAREQQRSELQQTTQALREAVEQMKRSQAGSSGSQSGAGAQGIAALDKLRDARRLLDRNQRQQLGRDMEELQQRAERVSQMQSRIEEQVEDLAGQEGEDGRRRSDLTAQERAELIERIMERKDRLTDEVGGLEAQLNRMTRSAREEQPEAARKLQASAELIRDEQLKEKIRYSKGVLAGRDAEFARLFEGQIRQDVDEVAERIAEARASVGKAEATVRSGCSSRLVIWWRTCPHSRPVCETVPMPAGGSASVPGVAVNGKGANRTASSKAASSKAVSSPAASSRAANSPAVSSRVASGRAVSRAIPHSRAAPATRREAAGIGVVPTSTDRAPAASTSPAPSRRRICDRPNAS